jgi:hypothetical protein
MHDITGDLRRNVNAFLVQLRTEKVNLSGQRGEATSHESGEPLQSFYRVSQSDQLGEEDV